MAYKNKYIFAPSLEGNLLGLMQKIVELKKNYKRIEGKGCLEAVSDDDALYIFGHGNLGKGLGPSIKPYSAPDLAKLLKEEYKLKDCACTIKLLACNSGVMMPGFTSTYACSFAHAMLEDPRYTKPIIHGYVGFVLPTAGPHKLTALWISVEEGYQEGDQTKGITVWESESLKHQVKEAEVKRVTYSIAKGEVELTQGRNWTCQATVEDAITDYKIEYKKVGATEVVSAKK